MEKKGSQYRQHQRFHKRLQNALDNIGQKLKIRGYVAWNISGRMLFTKYQIPKISYYFAYGLAWTQNHMQIIQNPSSWIGPNRHIGVKVDDQKLKIKNKY